MTTITTITATTTTVGRAADMAAVMEVASPR